MLSTAPGTQLLWHTNCSHRRTARQAVSWANDAARATAPLARMGMSHRKESLYHTLMKTLA
jgi:hypothetical protein